MIKPTLGHENYHFCKAIPVSHLTKTKRFDERMILPKGLDLSDAWVVKIVETELTKYERGVRRQVLLDGPFQPGVDSFPHLV